MPTMHLKNACGFEYKDIQIQSFACEMGPSCYTNVSDSGDVTVPDGVSKVSASLKPEYCDAQCPYDPNQPHDSEAHHDCISKCERSTPLGPWTTVQNDGEIPLCTH